MAFVGVEFDHSIGGGIAIVNRDWLTPRKKEVFWPPYKNQEKYNKAVKLNEKPDEDTWGLCKITRVFFEVEDYESAHKKIKLAENTSDVQSDAESLQLIKRKRCPPRRYSLSESAGSENDDANLPRPPPVKHSRTNSIQVNKQLFVDAGVYSASPSSASLIRPSYSGQQTAIQNPAVQTSTSGTAQAAFEELLKLMSQVKEQNKQILAWIEKQSVAPSSVLPENLPVSLPVKTIEDLEKLEIFLREKEKLSGLSVYLSTLGGKDTSSVTNYVMKRCVSNAVAAIFSFYGKRSEKKAFMELSLKTVIVGAVLKQLPQATEREVEDNIKVWLKHAPQRLKVEQKTVR